jgi:hypothetical protein
VHARGHCGGNYDPLPKVALAAGLKREIERLIAMELNLAELIGGEP